MSEEFVTILQKVIKLLNQECPEHAPFVCLGFGHSFNKIYDEEGDIISFFGIALTRIDIERIINSNFKSIGIAELDYWEGSDTSSYYFAPLNSDIAEANPSALIYKPKGIVEIKKIVL